MERRSDRRSGLHHRAVRHVQPHRQCFWCSTAKLHGHGEADIMSDWKPQPMPNYIQDVAKHGLKIKQIQDADATGETAAVYEQWRKLSGRTKMPGILKCFRTAPRYFLS